MARFILNITARLIMAIIIVAIGLAMYPNKSYAAVSITALGTANNAAGTSPWTAKTGLSLTADDYVFVAEAGDSGTSAVIASYDMQSSKAEGASSHSIYGDYWICQTFTIDSSYSIGHFGIHLYKNGSPGGNLTANLYQADASHHPTGSSLSSGSVAVSSFSTNSWVTIPITSYTLSTSQEYVIVLNGVTGDSSNFVNAHHAQDSNGAWYGNDSIDGGANWTNGSEEFTFVVGVSVSLTADVTATNSGNVVSKIWSGKVPVTGTAYYVIITNTSTAKAMAAYKASGITGTSAKDQTNSATGTGTGRAVSTSGNPTNAGDLAIVCCGIEQHVDDGAGTWENDTANDAHANAQFDGTTGGGSAANICVDAVADITDNNTTVEHGHNTGPTNADYAIAIATYKMATDAYTLSNTPSSKDFGIVATSTTYYAKGSAPSNPVQDSECTFSVSNDGASAFKINIHGHNATGGNGWTLGNNPGADTFKVIAYYSGENPASGVVLTTSDQQFYASLAASAHLHWDFELDTPTSHSDGAQKTFVITLSAIAP